MNLASLSIKRPIMVSMFLIVFLIFGILAYFALPLNLLPAVEFPFVTVQTIYPGAGPKEIETQVTKKIEDAISMISKISWIRSYSMEGVSLIVIRFDIDKDADIANQEVKDKVNGILIDLPQDAKLPIVEKFDMSSFPIMDIILTGRQDIRELFELADKNLKDRLSQVEGVAKVDLVGGEQREIKVELDNRVVYQNAISLQQLAQILAAQNMDIPGGHFTQSGQEYSVRLKGDYGSVEAIKDLDIPTAFGNKKLAQLADVQDAGAEIRERTSYFDNLKKIRENEVVMLSITKSSGGNTVKMSNEIQKLLPELEKELPAGCKLTTVRDASLFVQASVDDTLGNIIMGVLLTGLVLLFFLHDLRSTIIVATAMPYSILSTFLFMQISDFTLDIMSLMGLSTAVGILVTNSVVVLENIFRHKEMGHNRKDAAEKGTSEIAIAVLASTLTNLVVFLPIASMSGMVGQFFKEFALTVTYATIFSLLVSFTVTPMLAALILPEADTKKHPLGMKLEAMFHRWEQIYQRLLKFMIVTKRRSLLVIVSTVVAFIMTMFYVAPQVGFEFMPIVDEGDINIEVELPQGYDLQQTAQLLSAVESRLQQHDYVKHIVTAIGSISQVDIGVNMAVIRLKLVEKEQRAFSSNAAANLFIRELSDIPNAKIRVAAVSSFSGGEAPVQFYLLGQDVDSLTEYKSHFVEEIRTIEGLVNLNTSSRPGKPEITLLPDRNKIADAGLTIYDLAMTLRNAVEGTIVTRYREAGNEYDIRLSLSDESVNSPEEVSNIAVPTRFGMMRLAQLADVQFTEGYSSILHKDKFKAIEFNAFTAPGYVLGDIVNSIQVKMDKMPLPIGYKFSWSGEAEMLAETVIDMLRTFILAFLLTYMLLAAMLESLTQPLMIIGTVPMALIGVFLAMWITGSTMNIVSMMAIVMLIGIVVNNAILLLDYTNQLRAQGSTAHDALIEACPTKLKPIIMATLAIILGMLPMALGLGSAGREFRQPMGIVSIGGLVASTLLTLFVIPALYHLTTRQKKSE